MILKSDPTSRPTLDDIANSEFMQNMEGIPRTFPVSTMACPPSLSQLEKSGEVLETDPYRYNNREEGKDIMERTEQVITTTVDKKPFVLKKPPIRPAAFTGTSVWVNKWVDYSSKYGLGYTLSNSNVGVFFNDQSKILL